MLEILSYYLLGVFATFIYMWIKILPELMNTIRGIAITKKDIDLEKNTNLPSYIIASFFASSASSLATIASCSRSFIWFM